MHIADHDLITERYFFPRPDAPADIREVEVAGASLACAHIDGGHQRTLLHFHGNGEVVADYLPDFPTLMDGIGLNTFFAEYRGYGASTGTPRLGTMLDDIPAIAAAVGAPENLIVFGRSIGSIYAIEFARRYPQIRGLVLESGIADVLERILLRVSPADLGCSSEAIEKEFAELFDHKKKLMAYKGPCLVLHAQHDHLVSVSHAKMNSSNTGGSCKLVVLPRGDHNSIFFENRERYLSELGSFVSKL